MLIYLPAGDPVELDLTRLSGDKLAGYWLVIPVRAPLALSACCTNRNTQPLVRRKADLTGFWCWTMRPAAISPLATPGPEAIRIEIEDSARRQQRTCRITSLEPGCGIFPAVR